MSKSTDYQWEAVKLPDTANGANSRPFTPPRGAKTAVIFVPDLTGAATTVKLQALQPQFGDQDAEVWSDAVAVIFATGSSIGSMNLAGFLESTTYTLPIQGMGGATLRFVASVAQGATVDAFTIYVIWGIDR